MFVDIWSDSIVIHLSTPNAESYCRVVDSLNLSTFADEAIAPAAQIVYELCAHRMLRAR